MNPQAARDYILLGSAIVVLITGLIGILGVLMKPLKKTREDVDACKKDTATIILKIEAIEKIQTDAIKVRQELLIELNALQKAFGDLREWKAAVEESMKGSYKEREQLKDDLDYLEQKVDKLLDKMIKYT